ncbi:hypothetical protein HG530_005121 [Fusarium avenaceum]|nr:hypothetical protein HG530_005121 [Fusarium avenaceum]
MAMLADPIISWTLFHITLDLKGCLQSFELEEAKKIKNLERLHLTFLKPESKNSTWSWARQRQQLLETLREPQFSGLKWLTVHWEQERNYLYAHSVLLSNKTQAIRKVTEVAQALPHLERLVITFQEACGLSPSVCRAKDSGGNNSLARDFVSKVTNLKEFWIVSSCYAHGAYSNPDGKIVSSLTRVCIKYSEDPVFPWSRHKE